jgi:hypothetical protein
VASIGVLLGTLVCVGVLPGTLVSVGVLPGTLVCTSVLPGAVVCTLALVLAGDYCIPAVLAPDGARTWTIAVVLATVTPAFRVGHHGHDGHEQPGAGQGRQRIMLTALTGRIRCQRGQHRWISGPVVGRELRFCHIQPAHGPNLRRLVRAHQDAGTERARPDRQGHVSRPARGRQPLFHPITSADVGTAGEVVEGKIAV